MFKPRPHRIVRLSTDYDYGDYAGFQLNFMDQVRRRILPSTRVYVGPELVFESNALGCKGPELEDGRPIVGIFGDSTVQGGRPLVGFPGHVWIGGAQPLNGGVEGSPLQTTVDRFLELQQKAPMVAVALHTGWHNLVYGVNTEAHWREQLDRVQGPPVIAHFKLVADFHPDALEHGYARFFNGDHYWAWSEGFFDDPKTLVEFKTALDHFNSFIAAYCAEKGRVLIDLEPVLAPKSYEEISGNYLDLIHPRPEAYERIGKAVAEQLAPHVLPLAPPRDGDVKAPSAAQAKAPAPPRPEANKGLPETGRNYPLW